MRLNCALGIICGACVRCSGRRVLLSWGAQRHTGGRTANRAQLTGRISMLATCYAGWMRCVAASSNPLLSSAWNCQRTSRCSAALVGAGAAFNARWSGHHGSLDSHSRSNSSSAPALDDVLEPQATPGGGVGGVKAAATSTPTPPAPEQLVRMGARAIAR